jgi:hypothetical protein
MALPQHHEPGHDRAALGRRGQVTMSEAIDCINLEELEAGARKLLPQMAYDYYASGANDEIMFVEYP